MRPTSLLLPSLLFTIAIQTPAIAQSTSDPAPVKIETRENQWREHLENQVRDAWRNNDYKALEKMGEDFVSHPSKSYSGKWNLSIFMFDIGNTLKIEWQDDWNVKAKSNCNCESSDPAYYAEADKRWAVIDGQLKAWAKRYPHSLIVPLARTRYAENRAWFYRGSGYSSTVNDAAWPLFERYIKEANKTLKASAPIRFKNPDWYDEAAQLAVVADWPKAERQKLYAEMVERAPTYFPAFASASQFLQPQWGGDYQAIDDLIRSAQKRMPEKDGLEFYARVYWWYLGAINTNYDAPKEIAADWNMIKQGLEIVMERYPDRLNFDGAAQMACKYQDREYLDSVTRRSGTSDQYNKAFPIAYLDCNRPAPFFPEVHIQVPLMPTKRFIPNIPGMPLPPTDAKPATPTASTAPEAPATPPAKE